MARTKKKKKKLRLIIKLVLCLFYLLIMSILCLCAFKLFEQDQKIVKWKDVEKTNQYSYIKIAEMSEAFAEVSGTNKTLHFVIEEEDTGVWHTYIIAIDKKSYNKYKKIIDYTYERQEKVPVTIKVYGYPVAINKTIKDLALKNIKNFVPIENQVVVTSDNFEQYLTNTYLDTTKSEVHQFNYIILILLIMVLILLILLIFTIFDKDKIVDEVDEIFEEEAKKLEKNKTKSTNKGSKKTKKKDNNKSVKSKSKRKVSKNKSNSKDKEEEQLEVI